ncbi:MAG TPA: hypothetical protein VGR26_09670 [Acidimicrobiales bacterium]|nr:hypothetical protein [Acidimicrobiales bacterium]
MQRTKKDVGAYVYDHRKDAAMSRFVSQIAAAATVKRITAKLSKDRVAAYVNDSSLPEKHRQEIVHRWNSGQSANQTIPLPADLRPSVGNLAKLPTESLEGYDSDTEQRNMDVAASIQKNAKRRVTLHRLMKARPIEDVPVLDFISGVKFGRQVVKTSRSVEDYQKCLPFVVEIGGRFIEYNTPGTMDIYAYPLAERKRKFEEEEGGAPEVSNEPPEKRRRFADLAAEKRQNEAGSRQDVLPVSFQRHGGMSEHSWEGISNVLTSEMLPASKPRVGKEEEEEEEAEEAEEAAPVESAVSEKTLERIFGAFTGALPVEATPGEAVAIAAIGSDFMKGTAGAMHFVTEAKSHVSEPYKRHFTSKNPLYPPSLREGGRALVSAQHARYKKRRQNGPEGPPEEPQVLVELPEGPTPLLGRDKEEKGKDSPRPT